eukprot:Hpha_TRINITY_DN13086_c0_g2::TRINITY_DN13086_c0_g2_i1::g.68781::m.68781
MGLVWGNARINQYELIREGDIALAAGDAEKAVKQYSAALEMAPSYWIAFHKRAKAYRDLGMRELAITDISSAIALQDSLICRKLRAELLRDDGDEEGAAADEEAAALKAKGHEKKKRGKADQHEIETEEDRYWAEVEDRQTRLQGMQLHNSLFARTMRDRASRKKHRDRALSRVERPPGPSGPSESFNLTSVVPHHADEERARLGGGV